MWRKGVQKIWDKIGCSEEREETNEEGRPQNQMGGVTEVEVKNFNKIDGESRVQRKSVLQPAIRTSCS